jgi:hypothetical protein
LYCIDLNILLSIDQILCKAELGTIGMLDMYCLWTVEAGGRRPVKVLTFGRGAGNNISRQLI